MWLIIVPVSLAVLIYLFRRSWAGSTLNRLNDKMMGIPYKRTISRNKGRIIGYRINVPVNAKFEFSFTRENFYDRLLKKIGVNKEFQVGETEFDATIYIGSDSPFFHQVIKQDVEFRRVVLDAFRYTTGDSFKLSEIRCVDGLLTAGYRPKRRVTSDDVEEHLHSVFNLVKMMKEHLDRFSGHPELQLKDQMAPRARLINAISFSLIIAGTFQLIRFPLEPHVVLVEPKSFFFFVAPLILVIAMLGLIGAVFYLRQSSRTHVSLLFYVLLAVPGLFMNGYFYMRDINTVLDNSQARKVPAQIDERFITRTKSKGRYTNHYHLMLHYKNENTRTLRDFEVKKDFYESCEEKSEIIIHEKNGTLDYAWVEKMTAEQW